MEWLKFEKKLFLRHPFVFSFRWEISQISPNHFQFVLESPFGLLFPLFLQSFFPQLFLLSTFSFATSECRECQWKFFSRGIFSKISSSSLIFFGCGLFFWTFFQDPFFLFWKKIGLDSHRETEKGEERKSQVLQHMCGRRRRKKFLFCLFFLEENVRGGVIRIALEGREKESVVFLLVWPPTCCSL